MINPALEKGLLTDISTLTLNDNHLSLGLGAKRITYEPVRPVAHSLQTNI
jgi:hypothetical protein